MAKITFMRDGEEVTFLVDGKKITPVYVVEKDIAGLNFRDKVEFEADPIFTWKDNQGFAVKLKDSKPPLGVKPCFLAAEGRISDLADGIKRQLVAEKPDYGLIRRWSKEIEWQCELIEHDRRMHENKNQVF